MWNTTRACLLEAERADWGVQGDQTPPRTSIPSNAVTSQDREKIGGPGAGRRSVARARRATKKGGTPIKAGKEKRGGVLAPPEDTVAQGLSLPTASE